MAIPRHLIVNPSVTPWYHCISRCVRRTIIRSDLKSRIVQRMAQLSGIFTIDTASFSIMDRHTHQLVRLNIKAAKRLTRTEVLTRWAALHPPRDADRRPLKDIKPWLREKLRDHRFVNEIRRRLCDLSWYMKELKEWSALAANDLYFEEGVFWSGRFKSIAILDEAALLATSVYIDLNPQAAGICELPEEARFTSIRLRCAARAQRRRNHSQHRDFDGSSQGRVGARDVDSWLCPISDYQDFLGSNSQAEMLEGLTLDDYLKFVDHTARRPRDGKRQLRPEVEEILSRLNTNATQWEEAFASISKQPKLYGAYFSIRRQLLRDAARKRGCQHVANLNGCRTDLLADA